MDGYYRAKVLRKATVYDYPEKGKTVASLRKGTVVDFVVMFMPGWVYITTKDNEITGFVKAEMLEPMDETNGAGGSGTADS